MALPETLPADAEDPAAASVLVLAGGLSHERDVSLRSGRRAAESLRRAGTPVSVRDVDAGLLSSLAADPPDVVLPLLHGEVGEDGTLREVLELLGLPYVGSEPAACRLAYDKPTARSLLAAAGAHVPPGVALTHAAFRELGAGVILGSLLERIGLPLVVKPARGGSALGVTVVRTPEQLPTAMVGCFAYGELALVERFVQGVEVAVSVVDTGDGPQALPPVEVVPDSGTYDYASRYTAGATEFFVPARIDAAATAAVQELGVLAHTVLGLRDLSRTDTVLDESGRAWFLEANVAPGWTETSLFPMALDAAGHDVGVLLQRLVVRARARPRTVVA